MRRPSHKRDETPVDFAGREPERQIRMDGRTLNRAQSLDRRVTPEDFGGGANEGLITIRKFRLSDGVEMWHGRRGAIASGENGLGESCRAIFSLGDSRFLTFGSPVAGRTHSTAVEFVDQGSDVVRGRRSSGEGADLFDATDGYDFGGSSSDNDRPARGPRWSVYSQGLYWTVGVLQQSGGDVTAVQAFDPDTLESQFVTILDTDAHNIILGVAASPYGITVHRSRPLAVGGPALVIGGGRGIIERVDTDGTIGAAVEYTESATTSLGGHVSGVYDGSTIPVLSNVTTGPDGKVYFVGVSGASVFMRVFVTDTALESPTGTELDAVGGTQYRREGVTNRYYWITDAGLSNPIFHNQILFRFSESGVGRILVDRSTAAASNTPSGFNHAITSRYKELFESDGTHVATARSLVSTGITDSNGDDFYTYTLSIADLGATYPGPMLTRETDGAVVFQSHETTGTHTHVFPTIPYKVITSGGYHYCVGLQYTAFGGGSASHVELCKVNSSTGAVVWSARHSDDDGQALLDAVIVGDYIYVVGEGSTYEP